MTRVIVTGRNKETVKALLTVFSYFIRCSDCMFTPKEIEEIFNFNSDNFTNGIGISTSNTLTSSTSTRLQIIDIPLSQLPKARVMGPPFSVVRSLFASYCESYAKDFVLMGTASCNIDEIIDDLHSWLHQPLFHGETISSGHCILIDSDKW